jgi:hypothetical protein
VQGWLHSSISSPAEETALPQPPVFPRPGLELGEWARVGCDNRGFSAVMDQATALQDWKIAHLVATAANVPRLGYELDLVRNRVLM